MGVINKMAKSTIEKKQITLKIDIELYEKIAEDANLELRNINTQITYILTKYYRENN